MPEKRDLGLDLLKGIGCVLMIVAHSKLKMWNYDRFFFWGNLAPAFFFAVAGITATFQVQKYKPRTVLLSSLMLFLLGFSYNATRDINFLANFTFEIIQTIALGSLTVYLVEKYIHPISWVYLLMGFACFFLNGFIAYLLHGREFSWLTGIWVTPGVFPYIPWLSLFFIGAFAYKVNNYYNLLVFFITSIVYYSLYRFQVPDVSISKWDFLFDYFFALVIAISIVFFLLRSVKFLQNPAGMGLLLFWGKNSLLFFYIHYAFITYFRSLKIQHEVELIWNHPYLFWVLTLAATTIAMFIIIFFAQWVEPVFNNMWVWGILTVLVFITPLLVEQERLFYFLELAYGIIFATFYQALSRMIKRQEV